MNNEGAGLVTPLRNGYNMTIKGAANRSTVDPGITSPVLSEKTPLLAQSRHTASDPSSYEKRLVLQRISEVLVGSLKFVFTPIVSAGKYIIACFHHEDGRFSLIAPVCHMSRSMLRSRPATSRASRQPRLDATTSIERSTKMRRSSSTNQSKSRRLPKRSTSVASVSTAVTSDSEGDGERPPTRDHDMDTPSRHTRSKSSASTTGEEIIAPAQRQIRIRLHDDEAFRKRKAAKKTQTRAANRDGSNEVSPEIAAALKSPTSPIASKQLTKFPRVPQPPRPLVPRRQPSYPASGTSSLGPHQKTLVLDLDETLIHSTSKGGRYTTGHMVEVKLQQPMGAGNQIIGTQVPILYYVHKRPHCIDFLKKVCKWYNLVVFTASVQEYADPVIDWLETERKFFAGRYYRQHCTHRNGAYIKDLAQVEPDLSRVMIIDNSPMCYVFHEDNAIPIEGWTNDPTDNGLLHLIPLLEGLQYITDVRALLALRLGQPQMA